MPNITRGSRPGGLLRYLAGPGRSNEHLSPHVVSGDRDMVWAFKGEKLTPAVIQEMARSLDEVRVLTGTTITIPRRSVAGSSDSNIDVRKPAHIWHASLSLSADEGILSDEKWDEIARDFVQAMRFADTTEHDDCRWVAIRHGVSSNGNDHIHIAVSLVREDGTKASTHNDFRRAQDTCRTLEVKYGLAITADRAAGLGTRGVNPAEREASLRRGSARPDSAQLARVVRASAAASADEAEFVRRVRRAGVLIRPRFATGRDDIVEGYSVALRPKPGQPLVWHGGGKLARDLTLPRLRQEWPDSIDGSIAATAEWRAAHRGQRPTTVGREGIATDPNLWQACVEEIREFRTQIETVPQTDHVTWAIISRRASGVFAAWSLRVEAEPGPLAEVAAELARNAQLKTHAVSPSTHVVSSLGSTALLLVGIAANDETAMIQAIMIRELIGTAQAICAMLHQRSGALRSSAMATFVITKLSAMSEGLPNPARCRNVHTTVDANSPGMDKFASMRVRSRSSLEETLSPNTDVQK